MQQNSKLKRTPQLCDGRTVLLFQRNNEKEFIKGSWEYYLRFDEMLLCQHSFRPNSSRSLLTPTSFRIQMFNSL